MKQRAFDGALLLAAVASILSVRGERLYLMTGSPTPTTSESFSSALYILSQTGEPSLAKIQAVMPITEFILEDARARVLIAADFNLKFRRIAIVSEDAPGSVVNIDLPAFQDGWFVSGVRLLRPPSGGSMLALSLLRRKDDNSMEHDLWGIDLRLGASPKRLRPDVLEYAVAAGKSGLIDTGTNDSIPAAVRDITGAMQAFMNGAFIPLGFLAPPEFSEPRKYSFVLCGINAQVAALLARQNVGGRQVQSHGVWILNRSHGKWTHIETSHPTTEVRTFGSWVAIIETEGAAKASARQPSKRARREATSMGPAIAHRMAYRNVTLPGRVILYDGTTGRKTGFETGEDDTEVLSIQNGNVYYRVNDELFLAPILDGKVGTPVSLLKDVVIPDVHWMFFGPEPVAAAGLP